MKKHQTTPLFRFMLLRTFMPSIILLLVCVVVFCVLIVRSNLHNSQLQLNHQQELAAQRLTETEDELLQIIYQQREILNSSDFLEFSCMYSDLDWYNRYRLQNELHKAVNRIYLRDDYVSGIWIYWPDSGRTISSAHANAAPPEWLVAAAQEGFSGTHKFHGRLISVVVREDLRPEENAVLAVVLDERRIYENLQHLRVEGGQMAILWNSERAAESDAQEWAFVLEGKDLPVRILYRSDDENDQFVREIMELSVCAVVIMLLVEIFLMGFWHARIYLPLHRLLIDAFGQTEAGNYHHRISIPSDSPFFNVYDSYNRMMQKMEGYIENDLKQQVLVSRANLKQLQSQISPHFMYNSYYVLYRMLKKGDLENSQKLAEHLGHFYHYITRNADDEKRLEEEVAHARNYAAIQQFRFRSALEVDIQEPDAVIARSYVPRLILQPVLENAFKYAYESENTSGSMQLRVSYAVRDSHDFDILVENSGTVSDETLEAIRARLASQDEKMETTALVNIHRRLQIYFGQNSRLEVERSELGGLMVRMRIEDHGEEY